MCAGRGVDRGDNSVMIRRARAVALGTQRTLLRDFSRRTRMLSTRMIFLTEPIIRIILTVKPIPTDHSHMSDRKVCQDSTTDKLSVRKKSARYAYEEAYITA